MQPQPPPQLQPKIWKLGRTKRREGLVLCDRLEGTTTNLIALSNIGAVCLRHGDVNATDCNNTGRAPGAFGTSIASVLGVVL